MRLVENCLRSRSSACPLLSPLSQGFALGEYAIRPLGWEHRHPCEGLGHFLAM